MFFQKLNFYFSKKSNFCDILSQFGNARVNPLIKHTPDPWVVNFRKSSPPGPPSIRHPRDVPESISHNLNKISK